MNPVTLAPPGGSPVGTRQTTAAQSGRFQLSEYSDTVSRQNRREDVLLARRLSVLERQRSQSQAAIRKSFQRTEHFIETVHSTDVAAAKQLSPTLTQYDQWRRLSRYSYGTYCPGATNVDGRKRRDRLSNPSKSNTPRLSVKGDGFGSNVNDDQTTPRRPSYKRTPRSESAITLPTIINQKADDINNPAKSNTLKIKTRRHTVDENEDVLLTPLKSNFGRNSVFF